MPGLHGALRTLYKRGNYLHVAHDKQIRVVGFDGNVRFVQVFQYFYRHGRVAELEQFERRCQIDFHFVQTGRYVVGQIGIV